MLSHTRAEEASMYVFFFFLFCSALIIGTVMGQRLDAAVMSNYTAATRRMQYCKLRSD